MLKLKETPKPDDAADAVAAAICHGNSAGFIDRVKRAVSGAGG
jgi:crossover junction endodeoxyribonuclease RuvC